MSLIWSNKAWLELAVNMEVCLAFRAKLTQSDFQFSFSISGGFLKSSLVVRSDRN